MKQRKLLLISANRFAVPYPVYPIGLSYIYSYLADRLPHFEIRIFDMNLYTQQELIEFIHEFQPDYAGLSFRNVDDVDSTSQNSFILGYKELLDVVRTHSHAPIIVGGSAFSIFPKELYLYFNPDYGIYGEGEESLYRLLLTLEGDGDFDSIEGLVYRKEAHIVVNGRTQFLKNLDLTFNEKLADFYWDKSGMMNVQTKRGCPHQCIYCTYPVIEGRKVRTLNPDKIVETLTNLVEQKNINYVFFTDSVFNINKKYNQELAEKIIEKGLPIKWGAYFSPHDLDVETLKLFARAGLTHIEFGTESFSNATLKHYGKHFTMDDVIEVSQNCEEAGIYFSHFLILGGYGETEESIAEGFENCKKLTNTVFFPFIGMRIYPGTKLYQLSLDEGVIHADDDLIEPAYYLAKGINYETLKERADQTGRRWVFPDEDVVTFMNRMRQRKRKGSLWHHLKR